MALVHVSTSDRDRGRREVGSDAALQMDWMGGVAMAAGLFSTMYAFAAASHLQTGWRSAHFTVALALGVLSLLLAAFIEVRLAACPLLPPDFFQPRSLPVFCLAALFFYTTFGDQASRFTLVWVRSREGNRGAFPTGMPTMDGSPD